MVEGHLGFLSVNRAGVDMDTSGGVFWVTTAAAVMVVMTVMVIMVVVMTVVVVVTEVIACAFFVAVIISSADRLCLMPPLGNVVEMVGQVGSNPSLSNMLTYLSARSLLSVWSGLTWDKRWMPRPYRVSGPAGTVFATHA